MEASNRDEFLADFNPVVLVSDFCQTAVSHALGDGWMSMWRTGHSGYV